MERIFTWVWRLNGLILFFGSLAIFGLIIFEFAVGGSRVKEDSPVLTTVAEDPDGVEQWGVLILPWYLCLRREVEKSCQKCLVHQSGY